MNTTQVTVLSAALAAILGGHLSAQGQRLKLPPGVKTNAVLKGGVDALVTTDLTTLTVPQLVQSLLGPGVVASNVVFHGASIAAGTFQGGTGIVGIDYGIVLSSGNIASVPGPNTSNSTSTITGTPGDPQLDALTTSPTFDACSLEFDFSCTTASQIAFQYVFLLGGVQRVRRVGLQRRLRVLPQRREHRDAARRRLGRHQQRELREPLQPGVRRQLRLLREQQLRRPAGGTFPCSGAFDTEMDGLTVVLTAVGTLLPGANHIKLAIADAGDQVLDSNVFIRGQSFQCGASGAYFAPPTPCGQTFQAIAGVPVQFTVAASAATGLPSNAVTLACGALPAGAANVPALPLTQAGQSVLVTTAFSWTPAAAQVGAHTLSYTATDQLSQVAVCTIHVNVLPVGSGSASSTVVGTGCVAGGQYPELRCDPPILGTNVDFEITHGLPNWPGRAARQPGSAGAAAAVAWLSRVRRSQHDARVLLLPDGRSRHLAHTVRDPERAKPGRLPIHGARAVPRHLGSVRHPCHRRPLPDPRQLSRVNAAARTSVSACARSARCRSRSARSSSRGPCGTRSRRTPRCASRGRWPRETARAGPGAWAM
jgi:hypothetical protein